MEMKNDEMMMVMMVVMVVMVMMMMIFDTVETKILQCSEKGPCTETVQKTRAIVCARHSILVMRGCKRVCPDSQKVAHVTAVVQQTERSLPLL